MAQSRWTPKDPGDQSDYRFQWGPFLDTGETIASHTVTAETGLTVVGSAINGTDVVIRFSDGTDDSDYDVTCTIVTSTGQEFTVIKPLLVRTRILKIDTE